jgi:exonuclease VII small subunit
MMKREKGRIVLDVSTDEWERAYALIAIAKSRFRGQVGDWEWLALPEPRIENGRARLNLSIEQWDQTLVLLGGATRNFKIRSKDFCDAVRLINSLNEGNPEFTPYEVPEPIES